MAAIPATLLIKGHAQYSYMSSILEASRSSSFTLQ